MNLFDTVPPSVTGNGTGRSTVRDGAVKVVLLEDAVMPEISDSRLWLLDSSFPNGEGLCGVDSERERASAVSGAGSVATLRGTGRGMDASSLSSSSHTALMRRLPIDL